jgi:hypothetical protein
MMRRVFLDRLRARTTVWSNDIKEHDMRRSLEAVARDLAAAHRREDSKTSTIKFFPGAKKDEVCLLEVSATAPTTGEIMPFRFGADAANGVEYPSIVILVSPHEWQDVQTGKLALPAGWDLATAEDL